MVMQFFKIKAEIFYLFKFPGKIYLMYMRDIHKKLGTLNALHMYQAGDFVNRKVRVECSSISDSEGFKP